MAVGGINKWVSSRKARGSRSDEPASKHQFQPINGVWRWTDERANAGRVGDRTRLSRPTSRARAGTGKNSSLPFQLTYKQRIVNNHITRLVHTFLFFSFFSSLISLIADGPHHYHPACGHKGSSHLSPVHALQFFIAMQVQHSYNSSNQWLNFTYSRSHAFRYERNNTNPTLVRIELTTSALAGVQVTY